MLAPIVQLLLCKLIKLVRLNILPKNKLYLICTPAPTSPPEQLSTFASSTSLTLMWSAPPFEQVNGIIQHYVISITELETGQVTTMTTSTLVIAVNNLHPYYTYECKVAAYTVGLGPYSHAVTIQLNEEGKEKTTELMLCISKYIYITSVAPSRPPTNVIGHANSSDTIHVSWVPPSFEYQNGMIQSYNINVTEIETGITIIHTSFTTSTTLFALHPYYRYEILVSAVTVAAGPYSEVIVVQTNPDGEPNYSTIHTINILYILHTCITKIYT